MENQLILHQTIETICQGISQQQMAFENENLVNPLLPNVDNPANPVVDHQPKTLSHFASRRILYAIEKSLEKLMTYHNFPLPANWTYSGLANDIVGEPAGDLVHLCEILKDLTMYGYGSDYFHQVLNILHTVNDTVSAGIVL